MCTFTRDRPPTALRSPRGGSGHDHVTTRHWHSSSLRTPPQRRNHMNVALWIVAGLLAVVLLVGSGSKLFVPKEKMAGMLGAASRWVDDFSPGALKAIAGLEL